MRLLSSLVGVALVAVAAVLLTLFALENTQVVGLSFLGSRFSGNIWWLVLGAAALGFLIALVLTAPRHVATSRRAYGLSQLNARHERDLADLQGAHTQLQAERDRMTTEYARVTNDLHTTRDELAATRSDRDQARSERDQLRAERDQLQAERERVVAERDQLRERLTASPAAASATADGYRPTVEPALMGAAAPVVAEQMVSHRDMAREDHVAANGAPMQPTAPREPMDHTAYAEQPGLEIAAAAREDQVMAHEPVETQPVQPSLGERLRAMVTGQPVDEVQAQDAQRDVVPTDVLPQMHADAPMMPARQPIGAPPMEDRAMPDRMATPPDYTPETAAPMPTDRVQPEAYTAGTSDMTGVNEPANATADEVQVQQEQPTLGERLRGLFSGPQREEMPPEPPAESSDRPPA